MSKFFRRFKRRKRRNSVTSRDLIDSHSREKKQICRTLSVENIRDDKVVLSGAESAPDLANFGIGDVLHGVNDWKVALYKEFSVLGHGSYSTVYRGLATQPHHKEVAVKWITDSVHAKKTVEDEIAVHRQLEHENIVELYDWSQSPEAKFLILELCREGALKPSSGTRYTELQRIHIMRDVASALLHMHTKGFVHLDVKLSNVLLDDQRKAKLCDFGTSMRVADCTFVTRGSVKTISPEMFFCEGVGPPTDIYAFGVLSWELLTSRIAYYSPETVCFSQFAHLRYIHEGDHYLNPDHVSNEDLQGVVSACLARDPEARPTAAEVITTLNQILNIE